MVVAILAHVTLQGGDPGDDVNAHSISDDRARRSDLVDPGRFSHGGRDGGWDAGEGGN